MKEEKKNRGASVRAEFREETAGAKGTKRQKELEEECTEKEKARGKGMREWKEIDEEQRQSHRTDREQRREKEKRCSKLTAT